ncbi:MAG: signal recognition particle protein [Thermoplasmata archaeon]|nr:MAG: signal recognition particle protein [Thermoplasmata archaeon]
MVLEGLGDSLKTTLRKIANAPHIDKELIKSVVKDIQRALLQADVNVQLVLGLTKEVEKRALTERPPAGMSSREHVIRIIYEELVNILGETKEVPLKKQIILMVGLYGQGKTTTAGKLSKYFQKKGLKPALLAGDTHRPAAYDQLKQIADLVSVPFYGEPKAKKAVKVVKNGLKELSDNDVIIVDTSGRHSLEDDLIAEIKSIGKVTKPTEVLLVLDAAVGQQAGPQAKAFHEAVKITGVVLTKLDGTAKGGGALSAVSETEAPIVFIGTGEHINDLEKFEPPRFISRLLGMGDIQSLLEKAEEVVDKERAEETARKMLSGKFTLMEMREQLDMVSGMGPLKKVMSMLPFMPGVSDKISDMEMYQTQDRMQKFKVIMDSMTEEEMLNPKLIKSQRITRIARGSGCEPKDVKELLKYYNQTRKMIKGFSSNRKMRKALMKQLKFGDIGM